MLTSYNGKTINYDAIGNPTNWRGYIDTLYWEGRRLSGIDVGSYYNSYYYNESGIRTRKSIWEDVSSELIDVSYIVDGSKILKETRTSNYYSTDTLYYYYDTNDSVTGFTLNGANYFYGKNIQGDIKYIYNVNGAFIAEYCYDAWGNLLSILDANGNTLTSGTAYTVATTNPFRYRGYYYDTETGLFYVGSRYYDPEIGRWLSPEPNVDFGEFDEGAGLLAYNVYAYCANNPVNFFDPTGEFIITITTCIVAGLIIGAVGGASYGAYSSYKKTGKVSWKSMVGYGLLGGAIGALVGWGAGAALTYFGVIGASSAAGTSAATLRPLLDKLSQAANYAAGKVKNFTLSAKHLLNAGGNYAKFNTSSVNTAKSWIQQALRSKNAVFMPNGTSETSFRIYTDMGRVIGSKGQTILKVVLDQGGKIWTAYPVNKIGG